MDGTNVIVTITQHQVVTILPCKCHFIAISTTYCLFMRDIRLLLTPQTYALLLYIGGFFIALIDAWQK